MFICLSIHSYDGRPSNYPQHFLSAENRTESLFQWPYSKLGDKLNPSRLEAITDKRSQSDRQTDSQIDVQTDRKEEMVAIVVLSGWATGKLLLCCSAVWRTSLQIHSCCRWPLSDGQAPRRDNPTLVYSMTRVESVVSTTKVIRDYCCFPARIHQLQIKNCDGRRSAKSNYTLVIAREEEVVGPHDSPARRI